MCYSCGSCWNDFDPVQSPPVVLRCRHIFCSQCANRFVHDGSSCPFRCNDTPLRNRDIRPLHVSVVSTTEADDAQAVQHAIQGQARLLRHHKESAAAMESQVGGLLYCVDNQGCSFVRYHSTLSRMLSTRKKALAVLKLHLADMETAVTKSNELDAHLMVARLRVCALREQIQRVNAIPSPVQLGPSSSPPPLLPPTAPATSLHFTSGPQRFPSNHSLPLPPPSTTRPLDFVLPDPLNLRVINAIPTSNSHGSDTSSLTDISTLSTTSSLTDISLDFVDCTTALGRKRPRPDHDEPVTGSKRPHLS